MSARGGDTERRLRADTQRTRNRLLDVLGQMMEREGLAVSLPDLAREAGVATATVYRHFDDVHELRQQFYSRIVASLAAELARLPEQYQGLDLFHRACEVWVVTAKPWARAATFIRSAEGYLERIRAGDPLVVALDGVLRPILVGVIEAAALPEQDIDYAILVWITLFDERVFMDLETGLGWSPEQIAARLSATVLAALGAPPALTHAAAAGRSWPGQSDQNGAAH